MKNTSSYDAIVVGAGPGGSSAAYHLARLGARVLLLDKQAFPRSKTCGDGITRRALRQLHHMGLSTWLKEKAFAPSGMRIGAPSGAIAAIPTPESSRVRSSCPARFGYTVLVRREHLDAALVNSATSAGACFAPGMRATGMAVDDQGAKVYTQHGGSTGWLRCQIVVAADGTGGSFSRGAGLQQQALLYVGARVYMAGDDLQSGLMDLLYEPDILPAYTWVFPMASDLCNVGVGVPAALARRIRPKDRLSHLLSTSARFRDRMPKARMIGEPEVAGLNAGFRPARTFKERLLAVGDAAGLINPLTGSGVSRALISGQIAAECACDALASGDCSADGLASYGERLWQHFGRRDRRLEVLRRLFRHRRAVDRLVALLNHDARGRGFASDVLRGEVDYTALLRPGALVRLLLWRPAKAPRSAYLKETRRV